MTKSAIQKNRIEHYLRSGPGMWAFLLHRLTGILLVLSLFYHLFILKTEKELSLFYAATTVMTLLLIVLYHAFNGLRVLLFDLGLGIRIQKWLFWILLLLVIILWLIAGVNLYA